MAIDSTFLAESSLSTLLCRRKRGREITHRYHIDFRLVSIHRASFIPGKDPIFPNFLSGFADLAVLYPFAFSFFFICLEFGICCRFSCDWSSLFKASNCFCAWGRLRDSR
ncbi:unnamed protein product [Citrullus colocynthis]|uniref:Uncharacterized protein n=1 Tax=Citrullus colocynthis TaxID=252529 RepID=A0ABP0YPW1_9ROSI